MMRRVILILLKTRDAANFAELPSPLARAGQEAAARSVLLPCKDSQPKLIRAPNVDLRTWAQAALTGGAALVTDLMFSIGMSHFRCAISQARRSAAGNEQPGLNCADDAPRYVDSTQGARCCGFGRVAITTRARGPGSGGSQRAASLQGFTPKADSSSKRRFENVGAGCFDRRRCASNRFDVFYWHEPVPLRHISGKTLRCRQRLPWSQLHG